MNDLVTRLSTQYHELGRAVPGSVLLAEPQPFGVAFQQARTTFAAWCGVGALLSLILFICAVAPPMVLFAMFLVCTVVGIIFNFMYSDTGLAIGSEDVFGTNYSEETLADNKRNSSNEDVSTFV
ncbi:hypothetical protein BDV93DRAFT_519990 [Ceratobasidium sp. AG-I]|nr:hypothetical protein BDV93DRAFT_519990 [Ceratobasidium sp. AG-I]